MEVFMKEDENDKKRRWENARGGSRELVKECI